MHAHIHTCIHVPVATDTQTSKQTHFVRDTNIQTHTHTYTGLELWVEKGKIGTSCKPADCFTFEKYKPDKEEPKEEPVASVFTVQWENTVDGNLCSLENNMEKLQSTQNNQLGMMQLMPKAQGVPQELIVQYMPGAKHQDNHQHLVSRTVNHQEAQRRKKSGPGSPHGGGQHASARAFRRL